ncbi:MAG: hypothetical protein A4E65_00800 [Syntrophorhabdus sp. PtaU1.Bin153]|nr:MAG: hypothetical protein A4E65_00800 [Syntrophorhabdus sp. PtaU1.Bin153]
MNLDEALALLRGRLDDDVMPYGWSNADLISYINQRRNEFARRTLYWRDSATALICSITGIIGTGDYPLDERIIRLERVKGSWRDTPLIRKTVSWMDTHKAGWEAAADADPLYYLVDKVTGYLTVWPKPATPGTIALTVSRLPLAQLTLSDIEKTPTATPLDFPLMWQEHLIDGVLSSAYGKPDSETRNEERERHYLDKWEIFIADVLMDLTRDRDVDTDADPLPDEYDIYAG